MDDGPQKRSSWPAAKNRRPTLSLFVCSFESESESHGLKKTIRRREERERKTSNKKSILPPTTTTEEMSKSTVVLHAGKIRILLT